MPPISLKYFNRIYNHYNNYNTIDRYVNIVSYFSNFSKKKSHKFQLSFEVRTKRRYKNKSSKVDMSLQNTLYVSHPDRFRQRFSNSAGLSKRLGTIANPRRFTLDPLISFASPRRGQRERSRDLDRRRSPQTRCRGGLEKSFGNATNLLCLYDRYS